MVIRTAEPADAEIIAEFNRRLAEETESKLLDEQTLLAGVKALIAEPKHGQYYVADEDNAVVGQLLITYEWSDWRNGQFWWIQSVYIAPDYRRSGIFRSLYAHVTELARSHRGVCGLRLYVERDNAAALHTYSALGMERTDYHVMEIELK